MKKMGSTFYRVYFNVIRILFTVVAGAISMVYVWASLRLGDSIDLWFLAFAIFFIIGGNIGCSFYLNCIVDAEFTENVVSLVLLNRKKIEFLKDDIDSTKEKMGFFIIRLKNGKKLYAFDAIKVNVRWKGLQYQGFKGYEFSNIK